MRGGARRGRARRRPRRHASAHGTRRSAASSTRCRRNGTRAHRSLKPRVRRPAGGRAGGAGGGSRGGRGRRMWRHRQHSHGRPCGRPPSAARPRAARERRHRREASAVRSAVSVGREGGGACGGGREWADGGRIGRVTTANASPARHTTLERAAAARGLAQRPP